MAVCGLMLAGFETVLLETRHVKAALSAMRVKTDRKDERGIAQLLRMGWFRPVHCKSPDSQEVRALLVAPSFCVSRKGFEERVREPCTGQAMLEQIADAMLSARASLQKEFDKLHTPMLAIVRTDRTLCASS
jgi:transposase